MKNKYPFHLLLSIIFVLFFAFGTNAQQSGNGNKAAAAESIINVIDPTNIPNSPSAPTITSNQNASGAQFFDNGYIRFALTGDAKKDEETYRREKEKLFLNNPDLYRKWVGQTNNTPKTSSK
jgi:hypothetical protein